MFTNQDPKKSFFHKSKKDPRTTKAMDGSGIYKDDERLGNSKLKLGVKSRFGRYTRMGPIMNDHRKYSENGIKREFMKRKLENE